ncbi:hypothetical protein ACHAWF_002279, partial [Thalassiosira exigua]
MFVSPSPTERCILLTPMTLHLPRQASLPSRALSRRPGLVFSSPWNELPSLLPK